MERKRTELCTRLTKFKWDSKGNSGGPDVKDAGCWSFCSTCTIVWYYHHIVWPFNVRSLWTQITNLDAIKGSCQKLYTILHPYIDLWLVLKRKTCILKLSGLKEFLAWNSAFPFNSIYGPPKPKYHRAFIRVPLTGGGIGSLWNFHRENILPSALFHCMWKLSTNLSIF